jgi:hypothetical protein
MKGFPETQAAKRPQPFHIRRGLRRVRRANCTQRHPYKLCAAAGVNHKIKFFAEIIHRGTQVFSEGIAVCRMNMVCVSIIRLAVCSPQPKLNPGFTALARLKKLEAELILSPSVT